MKREEKYKNTSTFTFWNANPKGRITGDCVVRAIATATNIPYNDVVKGMTEVYLKTGYVWNDKKGIEAYMKSIGWVKHQQPRKKDGTKYTGKEWSEHLYSIFDSHIEGEKNLHNMVTNIGGHHTTAFIDGRCMDIWDCTNKCVGNYWTEGEQR